MVLARLQVADRKHERAAEPEFLHVYGAGDIALHWPEGRGDCVGHHDNLPLVDIVMLENRPTREFARREHARRRLYGTLHRTAQLCRAEPGEILRMFEITYVVDADHQRYRRPNRTRVLDVQQVGTILAQPPWQVEPQPAERIRGDPAL